jgi:hypothetical protein
LLLPRFDLLVVETRDLLEVLQLLAGTDFLTVHDESSRFLAQKTGHAFQLYGRCRIEIERLLRLDGELCRQVLEDVSSSCSVPSAPAATIFAITSRQPSGVCRTDATVSAAWQLAHSFTVTSLPGASGSTFCAASIRPGEPEAATRRTITTVAMKNSRIRGS